MKLGKSGAGHRKGKFLADFSHLPIVSLYRTLQKIQMPFMNKFLQLKGFSRTKYEVNVCVYWGKRGMCGCIEQVVFEKRWSDITGFGGIGCKPSVFLL